MIESGVRDRVGLAIPNGDSAEVVEEVIRAEHAGVRQVWMTMSSGHPDSLTTFAAAAVRTSAIRLGTAIVPTYPRHPLLAAQQALAIDSLAPGRLRLGIGPSHRATIEDVYGIDMGSPLAQMREYTRVLRALSQEGSVDFRGRYYHVRASLPRTSRVPVLVSALREGSFRLAGELADGAISWLCPPSYLLGACLPALREGADSAGREAPPLVAQVSVALSGDRDAALSVGRRMVEGYARAPFYARMFSNAGFPPSPDGSVPDGLVDALVISGDEQEVEARLRELLERGLDELLVLLVAVEDEPAERERLTRLIGRL